MSEGGAPELDFEPLLGTDESSIDDKGRILITKKKRERLGSDFVMALGDVGCLCAFPKARWRDVVRDIMQYDPINQGRQQYTRLVLGTADDDLNCDSQGRVVVPARLRKVAGLEGEVVVVGCGDRLEIWEKKQWEEYNRYPDVYGQQRRQSIEKAHTMMVNR